MNPNSTAPLLHPIVDFGSARKTSYLIIGGVCVLSTFRIHEGGYPGGTRGEAYHGLKAQ